MRSTLLAVALAFGSLASSGCAPTLAPATAKATPLTSEGKVHHLVLVWLKPETRSAETVRDLIAAQESLRAIPGLVSLKVGTAIPSERPVVDDSFDLASHFTFAGREEMNAYLSHPEHVAFLQLPIQQRVARIVVYDFE